MRKILSVLLITLCGVVASAHADEIPPLQSSPHLTGASFASSDLMAQSSALVTQSSALVVRAVDGVQNTLDQALELLGIRYRRGGNSPETGFDCSGFVRHVFAASVGLILPHSARAISQSGARIDKQELQPGDLVFFNTMRRAFSHVGIYLGNGQFVHSPRSGGRVRIEDMGDRYWSRRFDGARRVQP